MFICAPTSQPPQHNAPAAIAEIDDRWLSFFIWSFLSAECERDPPPM